MSKTEDILRQLGWQRLFGNPNPDILWYVFTGRSDLEKLDAFDVDIHIDCIVRLIRDQDADTPEELRPFWRLVYKTIINETKADYIYTLAELDALQNKSQVDISN